MLHMLPSTSLGNRERKAEEKRIQNELSVLTEEAKQQLILQNKNLSLKLIDMC